MGTSANKLELRIWFSKSFPLEGLGIDWSNDNKTGRQFCEFEGNHAFNLARLLPKEGIELVTIIHRIVGSLLHQNARDSGTYTHGSVKITVEDEPMDGATDYCPGKCIYLTAKDIDQAEEAYDLFRQGKLQRVPWSF